MTAYQDLQLLRVTLDRGVARVTIDNPPLNLLSVDLMRELNLLHRLIEADDEVRVVVFDSADPDFFSPTLRSGTSAPWRRTCHHPATRSWDCID